MNLLYWKKLSLLSLSQVKVHFTFLASALYSVNVITSFSVALGVPNKYWQIPKYCIKNQQNTYYHTNHLPHLLKVSSI